MDLLGWISTDLAEVRAKLYGAVVSHIPASRWAERVDGGGSTINHLLFHLARHQDLALTTAVRNHPPLYLAHRHGLGLDESPAWAGLAERDDPAVSAGLEPEPLLDYVGAVFAATAGWMQRIGTMAFDTVPDTPRRLTTHAQLSTDAVDWLYRMWVDKPVWWLLQWPVIGHGNAHVGEAISVRNRMGLSPF